jgi:hypothetical protein
LSGSIDIDLIFPTPRQSTEEERQQVARAVADALHQDPIVGNVEIYFHCAH